MKKIDFQDYPSEDTPITAEVLKRLQDNIEEEFDKTIQYEAIEEIDVISSDEETNDLEVV